MSRFLILSCLLAVALARPDALLPDQAGHISVTQNSLGTYRYFVHLTDSFRSEERFPDGSVIGEYSIIDANGVPQRFKYTAGVEGFKIIEGPVPVGPVDISVPAEVPAEVIPDVPAPNPVSPVSTPHLESPAVGSPAIFAPNHPIVLANDAPIPVDYTAEVKAARDAHLALYAGTAAALGH